MKPDRAGGGRARAVEPSAGARRLAVDDPDYAYACQRVTAGAAGRPAEQWAREVFEGAPQPLRGLIVAGWITVLRLRLSRPRSSPGHVLGWEIISATPAAAVLGVTSAALTARLVVQVEGDAVTHSTFLRYDRPYGKVLWALSEPVHRAVIPYLLNRAARGDATPNGEADRRLRSRRR
jgi:hypothetical protein